MPVRVFLITSVLAMSLLGARLLPNQGVLPASRGQQEYIHWNNLGVAYLDQQKLTEATRAFEKAHELDPKALIPELNRAIALLNQQKVDSAKEILERLAQQSPRDPHIWYNLGLLYRSTGQKDEALRAFTKCAEIAPSDADTQYFIGDIYNQLKQFDRAVPAFKRALAANRFHVSAEYGLARAYQRLGIIEEARDHLALFQRITHDKLGAPISQIYGEQGPLSLVQSIATEQDIPAQIHVQFALVGPDSGLPVQGPDDRQEVNSPDLLGSGVCVFDYDGDGRPDILLANNAGRGPALFRNLGGGHFEDVTQRVGLSSKEPAMGCAFGDYDNDGKPDLALTFPGRVALFRNEGGKFSDVTSAAGIRNGGNPFGVLFVDYDHDGDLDLYVTSAPSRAEMNTSAQQAGNNRLWRNNGNGTFTEVTADTGLKGGSPSFEAIASDVNNDRAVDMITTGGQGPPTIYLNPREGRFPASQNFKPQSVAATVGSSVLDFNKDGWMDLALTHLTSPGLTLWRNVEGKTFERVPFPTTNWNRAWGIAALDYDNDGWIDIAAIGETEKGAEIRLFRNLGPKGFEDVTAAVGLDKIKLHNPRALVAFDFDQDGATDLLITQLDGTVVLLRNVGGTQNHSLRIALKGLADNKSAFGTKVEVFAGAQHQKWEVAGSSGYLSQGPPEVLAGLGKLQEVDVVRLLWPTGVLQDEIQIAAGKVLNLFEIDRRGSSCPVLFAWNGQRYQLVTDVIGPAVIGHWVAPGKTDTADPDEYVKVDGSRVKLRDGMLSFRFAEPMEEVNYLDQVRLLAIDHSKRTSVFPNERFVSAPPFPEFKVITSQQAHPPRGAWDSSGNDVLPALLERDRKYVAGFPLLNFAGFAAMHTLELDLGSWDATHPLSLLMHGFTEYFTANSMYSANQAGVQVVAPYVDALNAKGKWVRVLDDMGFPAGLPRTMVADLTGRLPAGTRRIRISTNLQIFWDQILIDNSAPDLSVIVHDVPLADAALHFHGYPKSEEKDVKGDLDYIYEEVSATGPYALHIGNYTRYGDVLPLLKKADDKFVIFGSGEEVMLDFDPKGLPALPEGWERDYFFYANGFVKDMDFYESDALTVQPLPFHAMKGYPYPRSEHYPTDKGALDYQLDYNSRYQSGRGVTTYRFTYPEQK